MPLSSLLFSSQFARPSLLTHSTVVIADWMSSGRIPMYLQIVQIPCRKTAAHCRRIHVLVYRVLARIPFIFIMMNDIRVE